MGPTIQILGSVAGEGGPVVLVDAARLSAWEGIDGTSYEEVCSFLELEGNEQGGKITSNGQEKNRKIMLDEKLHNEINTLVGSSDSIEKLKSCDIKKILQDISCRYKIDTKNIWWWENPKVTFSTISYGSSYALELIKGIVGSDSEVVTLVVTDDEPSPWPAWRGELRCIIDVIYELRYFEYFLVGENQNWLIFDNHHNQLILMGSICDSRKK